jgi:hypothetical protein
MRLFEFMIVVIPLGLMAVTKTRPSGDDLRRISLKQVFRIATASRAAYSGVHPL